MLSASKLWKSSSTSGPFEDLVAHAAEDVLDVLAHAHQRVDAPGGALAARAAYTSTLPAGGRLDSSAARRSCSALSISVLRALTAAPKARRSSWRQALERLHQGGDRARLAAQELVVDRLQGAFGRGRGEARLELRAQRVDGGSVGHIKKKAGRKTRLSFTYPALSYAAGSAALACEATFANAEVSVMAMSASILRSSVMPAAFSPRISCE